jgi:hypothetical protein
MDSKPQRSIKEGDNVFSRISLIFVSPSLLRQAIYKFLSQKKFLETSRIYWPASGLPVTSYWLIL